MSEPRLAASTSDGVVLLHGISRTARSFRRMELALQTSGFATLNLDYDSRRKPLDALADDIRPAIAAFATGLDGPSISSVIRWADFWRGSIWQNIVRRGSAMS